MSGRRAHRVRRRPDPRRRRARPGSPRWRKLRWYVPARSGRSEGAANVAKVTMPQLGESVAEGTIGKWLKQPGDTVAKYEPLLEVITDKVNAEVPSPFEGVLKEILAEEGATVPNNAEIAIIETADEAGGAQASEPAPTAASVATEKEAAPSEPDTGGPSVEVREPQKAAGDGEAAPAAAAPPAAPPAPAHGPAGSDERPAAPAQERAAASATAAPTATAPEGSGGADARMTPAV